MITNINKQFFLEKPKPLKDREDELRKSQETYKKFLSDLRKRKEKAEREFEKEESRYKIKIKELQEELDTIERLNS